MGSWWGTEIVVDSDGNKYSGSADIDVVALAEADQEALIGECKFRNEKIDKGGYDTLRRRGELISGKYKISKYLLFSLYQV